MNQSLVFEVVLPLSYENAMHAVEDAFKLEGFGFLTHVDVRTTFNAKLNEEFRSFSIIGVCKPALAHRLLTADPTMGLLFPCKVTIEAAEDGESIVRIINPQNMVVLDFSDDPEIAQVAGEAEASIRRVVKALESL
ncbi:MAG TPA: DUF302 domain-containing protein [Bacteroidales bacterium]|nr:DUF302 domain-containing protein [Bacteroidales bacterium]